MILVMTVGSSVWLIEYNESLAKAICRVGNVSDYQAIMQTASYSQFNHQLKHVLSMLKVSDLPSNVRLTGAKIKTSKGVVGFVISQFEQGLMLSTFPFKDYQSKEGDDKRLYPQVVESLEDIKSWEIIEDDKVLCNCDKLTDHDHIMNFKDF